MGAIGHIDVYPNSRNVIPGKVVFTVDFLRSPELDTVNEDGGGAAEMAEARRSFATPWVVGVEAEKVGRFRPAGTFDHGLRDGRCAMPQSE